MKIITRLTFSSILILTGCSIETAPDSILFEEVTTLTSIPGKSNYLTTPFVSAGDRVYIIGNQDGSFPDLGWHINGEMGGVWDHPIKLMDGFSASIKIKNSDRFVCLNKANEFINYPIANRHHFTWAEETIEVDRIQFVPDGVEGALVEFRISNEGNEKKEIVFSFTGITDLRPTWLGERTNMIDAEDDVTFDEKLSAVMAKDKNNPWYVAFGSSLKANFSMDDNHCQPTIRKGLGKAATLAYPLAIEAHEIVTIPIFIAGSYQSEESVRATYRALKADEHQKVKEKKERYTKLNEIAHLTLPDKGIEQMYEWLKYNTDWLVRNVPEQGVGLSAGLPDYPWWFGADATYSLQGVLATGNHDLVKNTIQLLHKISQRTNQNGRIIHEVSTNGSVYNRGNVNETAQFITLVYNYYRWTGDQQVVKQLFPDLKNGMNWLLKEKDPDGNHYPNGSGMMEIPGLESELEMIDVAVYTQQALASMAHLAQAVGEQTLGDEYQKLAAALKIKINQEWWQPNENSFGDFRGTVEEAMPILDAALIRSDTLGKTWAVAELKNTQKLMKKYPSGVRLPHVIYHNWVVNTPLETGVADDEKAQRALKKAKTYENLFGVFVTGIDRTEEADSVILNSRKKTFSYTGAVMTLPTSVLAVGAAHYGYSDEALQYIHKLHQSFSYALPGSMYEVSPDFGMISQAWNIYGVAVPIITQFFGITPTAYKKSIFLSPHLPTSWNEASIDRVKVGKNLLSLSVTKKADHVEYHLQQSESDWSIHVDVKNAKKVVLNGTAINLASNKSQVITITGNKNTVSIY